MTFLLSIAVVVAAYLVGSVPTSYLVARRVLGIDIRRHGSGNVGASNVWSQVGRRWMVPVATFDVVVKGMLPVFVASEQVLDLGAATIVLTGLASVAGHNWPIFLGFQGGRGISVALGALAVLAVPLPVLWGVLPVGMRFFSPWPDSGIWWMVSTALLPAMAAVVVMLPGDVPIVGDASAVYFALGFLAIMVGRRVSSHGLDREHASRYGLTMTQMLINRVLYDRDIASREEWLERSPVD